MRRQVRDRGRPYPSPALHRVVDTFRRIHESLACPETQSEDIAYPKKYNRARRRLEKMVSDELGLQEALSVQESALRESKSFTPYLKWNPRSCTKYKRALFVPKSQPEDSTSADPSIIAQCLDLIGENRNPVGESWDMQSVSEEWDQPGNAVPEICSPISGGGAGWHCAAGHFRTLSIECISEKDEENLETVRTNRAKPEEKAEDPSLGTARSKGPACVDELGSAHNN